MPEIPPNFPDKRFAPFTSSRSPQFPVHGDELLSDKVHELKNFADIYGCQLFQARDDILEELDHIATDAQYRRKLGTVKAERLAPLETLTEEQRRIALLAAEEAMNHLIDRAAQVFSCDVRNYPGNYWIEFEIRAVVYKLLGVSPTSGPKLKKLSTHLMTGDPNVTLGSSFGRWLNKFGFRRSRER